MLNPEDFRALVKIVDRVEDLSEDEKILKDKLNIILDQIDFQEESHKKMLEFREKLDKLEKKD